MKLTEPVHACSHSKDTSSVFVARHDICLQVSWESAAHVILRIISSFYTKQQIDIFRIRVCMSAYMCVLDIQKSQTGGVNIPCLCEIWLTQMSGWLFVRARGPPRRRWGWFKEAPCQLHVKATLGLGVELGRLRPQLCICGGMFDPWPASHQNTHVRIHTPPKSVGAL